MWPGYFNSFIIKGFLKPFSQLTGYLPLLHRPDITQHPYVNARIAEVLYPENLWWGFDKVFKVFIFGQFLAYPVYYSKDVVHIFPIAYRNIQVNPSPIPGLIADSSNLTIWYDMNDTVQVAENGSPEVDLFHQTGNAGNLDNITFIVLIFQQGE